MKEFKKYYIIREAPEIVYTALTNPITMQVWTGEPAMMSTDPGSEFSLWDGSISGRNLEFQEGKKIVQEWDFGDQEAPSIVTIILHPHQQGTSVELRHTNIPDQDYPDIVNGWDESYFGQLADFFEN